MVLCFVCLPAHAGFLYWDKNGSSPGAGGPTPTGTWGVDAYWNDTADGTGTNASQSWPGGATVAFSAGSDATGVFTINVSGTQTGLYDMHFDEGTVTLQGGSLQMGTFPSPGGRLISALPGITGILNTVLATDGTVTNLTKYKMGTIVFGSNNTYACSTTIEGGTLQLGISNAIRPGNNLILANGGTDGFVDTPATFDAAGFSQTFGTLTLTGPNSSIQRTIDFGDGNSALVFADSSAIDWSSIPLWIVNYTPGVDSLRFGTNSSGLTPTQLASIRFADFNEAPGQINTNGFVTPATNFAPRVLSIVNDTGSDFIITWSSIPGRTYRLQYKDDLSASTWTDAGDIPATNTTASTSDNSGGSQRFYRIALLP